MRLFVSFCLLSWSVGFSQITYYFNGGSLLLPIKDTTNTNQYLDNRKEGLWKLYYKDGNIKYLLFYKNGKLDGSSYKFSKANFLLYKYSYLEGKKHGESFRCIYRKKKPNKKKYKKYIKGKLINKYSKSNSPPFPD